MPESSPSESQKPVEVQPAGSAAPVGSAAESLIGFVGLERAARAGSAQASAVAAEKRRPGQRGPDRSPRKRKLPVGQVGGGSRPVLDEKMPMPTLPPSPAIGPMDGTSLHCPPDLEAEKLFCEGVIDLLELTTGAVKALAVFRLTKDSKLSDSAFDSAKIPPAIREKLESSAPLLVRKYSLDTRYAPEVAFGGALLIYWGKQALDVRKLAVEVQKPAAMVPPATVNSESGVAA